jgi:hypothetical protein
MMVAVPVPMTPLMGSEKFQAEGFLTLDARAVREMPGYVREPPPPLP